MKKDYTKARWACWKFLVIFSLVLSLISIFVLWYMLEIGDDLIKLRDFTPDVLVAEDGTLHRALDSISYAQQVGRFDFISIWLAVFAIIMAIMTLGYFVYLRSDARNAAREEARDAVPEMASRLCVSIQALSYRVGAPYES